MGGERSGGLSLIEASRQVSAPTASAIQVREATGLASDFSIQHQRNLGINNAAELSRRFAWIEIADDAFNV